MKAFIYLLATLSINITCPCAAESPLPEKIQTIMQQPKYEPSIWGLYVKDLQTGQVLYDINSDKLFSPASTTKLFSTAALLHTLGDNYRFKTPVFASSAIQDGQLHGNLILVAQGDLTMGGRQPNADTIDFTKMDHIIANEVPGAILTKEDPLHGINELAKQISQNGLKELNGDVIIDDSIFDTIEKRGMILSPIMLNENLIDMTINPTESGQMADLSWRPQVPGYTVQNEIKTVEKDGALALEITADASGHQITIQGTIPSGQKNIIRTFAIKDPKVFARAALIQALEKQGIKVNILSVDVDKTPHSYAGLKQLAVWTSPPLSAYVKLILKVSHNLGADLIPLLLAVNKGEKSFDSGMRLIGDFVTKVVGLSPHGFVFVDAAGGNENRLSPQAEITLLEYMHKQSPTKFSGFFDALPVLGIDGSLADFAKNTAAVGKVSAKTGTGVTYNLATGKFFLLTQALAGYINAKNGHLLAYMLVVNNASMPTIDDIFAIFEDQSQISAILRDAVP